MDLRSRRGPSVVEVLTELDAQHGTAVRGYLRSRWRDHDQVEDLVQEVFIRARRSVESLTAEEMTSARQRRWLLTTAHNVLVDRWRADRRRPLGPVEPDERHEVADRQDGPDRVLDSLLIQEALARLSQDHRAVIIELYYRGRTVTETAEELGIAVGTAKSRSYYAVRALRAVFDELGVTR